MKVFSTFFRIMWKYKNSVMIYFVMFAGLSIVFGAIAGDSTKQAYKESDVLIAVFDHDKSKASEALYSYLDETHTIIEIEDNEEAKLEAFFDEVISTLSDEQQQEKIRETIHRIL